jgi:putative salt-induced outer membrane protein
VAAVIAVARNSYPAAEAEIAEIERAWRAGLAEEKARRDEAARRRLASAPLFENWKGQVELGASRSTGNSSNFGLYGAFGAERKGLEWSHKLSARADIQRTNGVTTTQRVLASWQPNYAMEDRLYAYGLTQYEHDKFLGYRNRYTLGGGLGYGVIESDDVSLDLEGGPAVRLTDFLVGETESTLAGRASLDFAWKISPTLRLSQQGSFFLESEDGSASAQTALDTRLIGSLKARFSYNVQYERGTPPGVDPVDTLSRATLIYSF